MADHTVAQLKERGDPCIGGTCATQNRIRQLASNHNRDAVHILVGQMR